MKIKGSITIEATFVIPMCFFMMIAFLYIGMYLHDQYVVETIIRTAMQREIRYMLQEEKIEDGKIDWSYWGEKTIIWSLTANLEDEEQMLKQYIEQSLANKLLIAQYPKMEMEIDTGEIIVSYQCSVQWPMNFLRQWIEGESALVGKVQVNGIEPQDWIRMCRGILKGKDE